MKNNKKVKISAVVLTRNEEEKLDACLNSIDWVDEIVVVDNKSQDNTLLIAKKHKATIVNCIKEGFDEKRNVGTNAATGDWVIHIDADERSTPELKDEIIDTINNLNPKNDHTSFAVPRRNIVFGKEMKYCGLRPDYVEHLLKKSAFTKWQGALHETPKMKGNVGYLKNSLIHLKHERLSEMVEKTNKWSEIEAKLMFDAGHPSMNIIRFTTAMGREFWLRMIIQRAFLDKGEGIIYGFYQVWSRFISYAKLWELQLINTPKDKKNLKTKNTFIK